MLTSKNYYVPLKDLLYIHIHNLLPGFKNSSYENSKIIENLTSVNAGIASATSNPVFLHAVAVLQFKIIKHLSWKTNGSNSNDITHDVYNELSYDNQESIGNLFN